MAVHRVQLERRFSDLDLMRHVNNAVYGDYFQEARIRLNNRFREMAITIPPQVVARQEIDYVRPLHLKAAPIVVELWLESVSRSSYVVRQTLLDDEGWVSAKARTVIVTFDKDAERSMPIPEDFRAFLLSEVEVRD